MTPSPSWQAPRSPGWIPPPGSSSGTPNRPRTPCRTRSSGPGVICPRCAIPTASTPGSTGCSSVPASMRRDGSVATASTSSSPTSHAPATAGLESSIADRDQLERGFLRLDPEMRAVIVLHHYLDLPMPAVAATLGIPLGTAKSRLHRALGLMRAALDADTRAGPRPREGASVMTSDDMFGRDLSRWLQEEGEHRVPDHLAEVLVQTVATRQRRWWSSPERWLPMQSTLRLAPVPRVAGLIVVLALVIAAIVAIAGRVRSQAARSVRRGPIRLLRPQQWRGHLSGRSRPPRCRSSSADRRSTSAPCSRTTGPTSRSCAEEGHPDESVADPDGRRRRRRRPPRPVGPRARLAGLVSGRSAPGARWPRTICTSSTRTARPRPASSIRVASTSRPGCRPTGRDLRPPGDEGAGHPGHPPGRDGPSDRIETSARSTKADYGAWPCHRMARACRSTDGRDPALGRPDPARRRDGHRDRRRDLLPTPVGDGRSKRRPWFSPDGPRVAYARTYADGTYQAVVAPADGSDVGGRSGHGRRAGRSGLTKAFTPDGTALIARYGSDDAGGTYLVPRTGPRRRVDNGAFDFLDVQRLAP